jgi:RimJ/RimL family protein N-acetyltransferase
VMLEATFTFKEFRGRGIILYALPEFVKEAERLGARWLFSWPSAGDQPMIRILERAGFVPHILRRESYRLLRRRVTFTAPPAGALA